MSALANPVEQAIERAVDKAPLRMTPALLNSFIHDMARGYLEIEDIAARYGFADVQAIYDTLVAHPALLAAIKAEKAIWASDDNLERRLRVQHQLILHETAHENARPLFDPSTTVAQRVDLMKAIATVGGVHGMPGGGGRGMDGAEQGPRWTIQMVFPNAGKVEEITLKPTPPPPPTIDAETC